MVEQLQLPASLVRPMTVRQIVGELCSFNASSTLCWDLLKEAEVNSTTDQLDTAMRLNGALQQVFARCAQPVWRKVEEVVAAEEKISIAAPSTLMTSPLPPAADTDNVKKLKPDLVDFLKLNNLEDSDSLLQALRKLEVFSMTTVQAALEAGELTAEELKANGCRGPPAAQFIKAAKTVSLGGAMMVVRYSELRCL